MKKKVCCTLDESLIAVLTELKRKFGINMSKQLNGLCWIGLRECRKIGLVEIVRVNKEGI